MTLKDYLNSNDRYAAMAGAEIVDVRDGYSRVVMEVKKWHLNAGGVCQGGAIFTLADLALAAVMNSHGKLTFSLESNITFLHSAFEGDVLTAEASEVCNHKKIPFYEVKIYNQENQIVSTFTSIAYRKKDDFRFDSLE